MTPPERAVDEAMSAERPQKHTVRSIWIDEVKLAAKSNPQSAFPWYLTLSGAQGLDIQQLIEEGLIELTEVKGIAQEDMHRIVAVESSPRAVALLQRKFVGLKIIEANFQSLVRGEEVFNWPEGIQEEYCKAHVVNLDLNAPLMAGGDDTRGISFPVVRWISKLCALHSRPPVSDWTLLLTLHAEINWQEGVVNWTSAFLNENFNRVPNFEADCTAFLGQEFMARVRNSDPTIFTQLPREMQQKFVLMIVPKLITREVHNSGWCLSTSKSLLYGEDGQAPMVTWVLKFALDPSATALPDQTYKKSLESILSSVARIDGSGTLHDV